MAYNVTKMHSLLIATIAPANAVDKAKDKLEASRQEMAVYALSAMRSGELTLEAFREEMVNAWKAKLPKAKAKEVTSLKSCGSTYAGIYYDIRRVASAGKAHIARVVDKGESLTTVRRDTKATQPQATSKAKAKASGASKGKALPSLNDSIAALRHYIAVSMADNAKANALAANSELAALIADIAKLEKKVTANLAKVA